MADAESQHRLQMASSLPIYLGQKEGIERREQSCPLSNTRQGFQGIPVTLVYAGESSRKGTFKETWPHDKRLAERLARDGLFYIGSEDCTKCFSCGIPLKNWKSDAEPWKVHARLNKNCSFLRLKYGEAEVDREWDSAQEEHARWFARKREENERLLQLDIQSVFQTLHDQLCVGTSND